MRYQKYSMMLFVLCFSVLSALGQTEILTRVNGGASWVDYPGDELGANVDLSLTGTILTVSDGTNSDDQDLSTLQDGTGTDDQTIDVFGLSGTELHLSIEGDGQNTKKLELEPIIPTNFVLSRAFIDFPNIPAGGSADIQGSIVGGVSINAVPIAVIGATPANDNWLKSNHIRITLYKDAQSRVHFVAYNEGTSSANPPNMGLVVVSIDGF